MIMIDVGICFRISLLKRRSGRYLRKSTDVVLLIEILPSTVSYSHYDADVGGIQLYGEIRHVFYDALATYSEGPFGPPLRGLWFYRELAGCSFF